ncbi:hypothetical protein ABTU80_003406 [Enterobacter cloacae]
MNLKPVEPTARDLVDRARILVGMMLENPDETGPNHVLLLLLYEAFKEAEERQLRDERLPD